MALKTKARPKIIIVTSDIKLFITVKTQCFLSMLVLGTNVAMGRHTSVIWWMEVMDLLDVPDDDQYDTEDSFIDDAELVGIFGFFLVYLSLS